MQLLLTKAILKALPPLHATDGQEDPMCIVKFFYPDFHWTWYVIEGEPQDDGDMLFFGYVAGDFPELGYFSLRELTSNRGVMGCPIERDLYFKPTRLSEIRAIHDSEWMCEHSY